MKTRKSLKFKKSLRCAFNVVRQNLLFASHAQQEFAFCFVPEKEK
jgi:hypothetical protein